MNSIQKGAFVIYTVLIGALVITTARNVGLITVPVSIVLYIVLGSCIGTYVVLDGRDE